LSENKQYFLHFFLTVDTAKDSTEGDSKEHESTNLTNVEIDSLTTVLVNHNREQGTKPNYIFRQHFQFLYYFYRGSYGNFRR